VKTTRHPFGYFIYIEVTFDKVYYSGPREKKGEYEFANLFYVQSIPLIVVPQDQIHIRAFSFLHPAKSDYPTFEGVGSSGSKLGKTL
jgi:hypothetical protein